MQANSLLSRRRPGRETQCPVNNVCLALWNPGRERKQHVLGASTLTPLPDEIWALPCGVDLFELKSLMGKSVYVSLNLLLCAFLCIATQGSYGIQLCDCK